MRPEACGPAALTRWLRSSPEEKQQVLEETDFITDGDRFAQVAEEFDTAGFLEHTTRAVQQLPRGSKCAGWAPLIPFLPEERFKEVFHVGSETYSCARKLCACPLCAPAVLARSLTPATVPQTTAATSTTTPRRGLSSCGGWRPSHNSGRTRSCAAAVRRGCRAPRRADDTPVLSAGILGNANVAKKHTRTRLGRDGTPIQVRLGGRLGC